MYMVQWKLNRHLITRTFRNKEAAAEYLLGVDDTYGEEAQATLSTSQVRFEYQVVQDF